MKIILDIREHDLYDKLSALAPDAEIEKQMLPLGDIILSRGDKKIVIIERKSISDLLASIKDGRYREQSYRLVNSAPKEVGSQHNIIYLIEGIIQGQNPAAKKQIYGAITSLNYFKGFSVLRTSSLVETAELIYAMSVKLEKELTAGAVGGGAAVAVAAAAAEDGAVLQVTEPPQPPANYATLVKKNKRENINSENIGAIMLCQIPGISGTTATQIINNFGGTIKSLIENLEKSPDCLNDFKVSATETGPKKRISKTVIENIKNYLIGAGA
jgi:ERCC4-type nuclease